MPNSRQAPEDATNPAGKMISRHAGGLMSASGMSVIVVALLLFAGLISLFYQLQQDLDVLETQLIQDAGGQRMKLMGEQMVLLQGRLNGLMADSVEIRLKALERSLASGQVTPALLEQFEVLKNDIRSLESYADGPHARDLDQMVPDHPRFRGSASNAPRVLTKAEMFQEISRLRTLLYLCLTGLFATGGVFLGRYWLMTHRASLRLPPARAPKPPLLSRRR